MKGSEEERHGKFQGKGQVAWTTTQSPGDMDSGHPSCRFPCFTLIPPLLFASSVEFRPSYVSLSPIPPPLCASLFFPLCFSPPLACPTSLYPSLLYCVCLPPSVFPCLPLHSLASLPASSSCLVHSPKYSNFLPYIPPFYFSHPLLTERISLSHTSLASPLTYTFLPAYPSPLSFYLPFDLCSSVLSPLFLSLPLPSPFSCLSIANLEFWRPYISHGTYSN